MPGLLIERASEVATLAGGVRTGARMDDVGVVSAPGGDVSHEPKLTVALLSGPLSADAALTFFL